METYYPGLDTSSQWKIPCWNILAFCQNKKNTFRHLVAAVAIYNSIRPTIWLSLLHDFNPETPVELNRNNHAWHVSKPSHDIPIAPSHESLASAWPVEIPLRWDPNGLLLTKVSRFSVFWLKQIQMSNIYSKGQGMRKLPLGSSLHLPKLLWFTSSNVTRFLDVISCVNPNSCSGLRSLCFLEM